MEPSRARIVATLLYLGSFMVACSTKTPVVQRANPASTNCVQQGGKHVVERGPGGEFGICQFSDNRSARSGRFFVDNVRPEASV